MAVWTGIFWFFCLLANVALSATTAAERSPGQPDQEKQGSDVEKPIVSPAAIQKIARQFLPYFHITLQAQQIKIDLDQSQYVIDLEMPAVLNVQMTPPPDPGLVSYGVKLSFDSTALMVTEVESILVPPALNFNGPEGAGAVRALGDGFAAVKGTTDFFRPGAVYNESFLATFRVKARPGAALGAYPVRLSLFNTLGPTEQIFVTSDGQVLDNFLSFEMATVTLVPEPSPAALLSCGLLFLVMKLRGSRSQSVYVKPTV